MSNNNVINEKRKALLAYKEKILEEIKYYERSIDDFRANHKNNSFYDDYADSSDSEDDFPCATEAGPSITQLKLQQAMMKTCLHATQELTSLMVLQSEVDVLIEEPKLEGERPVTEAGTWREVTAECRIDLVPFTMTFFMHTPDRKFAPPSYRGLRVVPVKSTHEMELTKSVLHSLKVPSDAVEVLRSYAAGYRSRRTTLARLANKYTNSLFMEPHAEGGFVLKCADLLEVSWRLENKWSPVAPFHHRMKFDLEYMDESYIKIITQAHKQLLDPTLQADDRTLLLAKIITTCLEARGPIDPESDLESKTTERDNDIDKRDSENEKRDSEVMAPPKSLPKKGKQKSKDSLPNNALKRSMGDDNGQNGAKKLKSNVPIEANKSIVDNNSRKSKMSDVVTEIVKKRKINEVNKAASAKNVEDGNAKTKDMEDKPAKTQSKPKTVKESKMTDDRSTVIANNDVPIEAKKSIVDNNSRKTKTNDVVTEIGKKRKINEFNKVTSAKNVKDTGNVEDGNIKTKEVEDKATKTHSKPKTVKESTMAEDMRANKNNEITAKDANSKPKTKNLKEPANTKSKSKIPKEMAKNQKTEDNDKPQDGGNKDSATKNKNIKDTTDVEKVKNVVNKGKNVTAKDAENPDINNANTKTIDKKMIKNVYGKSKENIDSNKDAERPKSKIAEKNSNDGKHIHTNVNNIDKGKNTDAAKVKNVVSTKNDVQTAKKAVEINTNVATSKSDDKVKKASDKNLKNKDKVQEVVNKASEKSVKEKTVNNKVKNDAATVKKVTEKNATNIRNKDKISQITTKVTEKVVKDRPAHINIPEKALNSNLTTKNTKEYNKNIKKTIIHKIASHRNSLKPQNPPKGFKAGNTKTFTGNTEKENVGKVTKIPQKTLSTISEGSSKKNMLRMSPRQIPSKFKTMSQETFKQKMVKTTNIPRLLKKPAPKV